MNLIKEDTSNFHLNNQKYTTMIEKNETEGYSIVYEKKTCYLSIAVCK